MTVMKHFKEAVTDNHFFTFATSKIQRKTFVWSWWRSCTTAAPKASSTASRNYCICVHSPQVQTHFQLHFYHPHVLIECHMLCGGRLCQLSNCKCRVSPPLISTALKLLHLPSSSAAIERVFSNFGLVQSKWRNHFSLEKAAKHVTCYRQLRRNAELNWIGNWNEHWMDQDKWNI